MPRESSAMGIVIFKPLTAEAERNAQFYNPVFGKWRTQSTSWQGPAPLPKLIENVRRWNSGEFGNNWCYDVLRVS